MAKQVQKNGCFFKNAVFRAEMKKASQIARLFFIFVILLGLEPRTPTLKVLCSTG